MIGIIHWSSEPKEKERKGKNGGKWKEKTYLFCPMCSFNIFPNTVFVSLIALDLIPSRNVSRRGAVFAVAQRE